MLDAINSLAYLKFDEVCEGDFVIMLNKPKIREHLVEHDLFDEYSIKAWVKSKLAVDAVSGCRVRAINFQSRLVGWCGIQLEAGKYEIAIVLDEAAWGLGRQVFLDVFGWAKELKHEEVSIHLFHTRPEYRFLAKMAKQVFHSELYGKQYTTYLLAVE